MTTPLSSSAVPVGSGVLMNLEQATQAIRSGAFLCLAADEALLRQLPRGNWIAGSIPYFMGQDGGETTRQKLFVSELPARGRRGPRCAGTTSATWDADSTLDAPAHGPERA